MPTATRNVSLACSVKSFQMLFEVHKCLKVDKICGSRFTYVRNSSLSELQRVIADLCCRYH
eukprot:5834585-Pleurochrysis_carterae.AAC.1